MFYTKIDIKAA